MAADGYPSTASGHGGYASSYAVAAQPPAPPMAPPRLHWANWAAVVGAAAMFLALVAVALDLPSTVLYDESAPGKRVLYEGYDPVKANAAVDSNMRYIRAATGDAPKQYNGLLASIDESEDVMPAMGVGVGKMSANVDGIDQGLGKVLTVTRQMGVDMSVMSLTSASSARTMAEVSADMKTLGATMRDLYGESDQLERAMARIERRARGIAAARTGPAASNARELNAVLPADLPTPQTSLSPGGAQ
jgi:hypothetical protein